MEKLRYRKVLQNPEYNAAARKGWGHFLYKLTNPPHPANGNNYKKNLCLDLAYYIDNK